MLLCAIAFSRLKIVQKRVSYLKITLGDALCSFLNQRVTVNLVAGDTVTQSVLNYSAMLLGDGGVGKSSLILSVGASLHDLYISSLTLQ